MQTQTVASEDRSKRQALLFTHTYNAFQSRKYVKNNKRTHKKTTNSNIMMMKRMKTKHTQNRSVGIHRQPSVSSINWSLFDLKKKTQKFHKFRNNYEQAVKMWINKKRKQINIMF